MGPPACTTTGSTKRGPSRAPLGRGGTQKTVSNRGTPKEPLHRGGGRPGRKADPFPGAPRRALTWLSTASLAARRTRALTPALSRHPGPPCPSPSPWVWGGGPLLAKDLLSRPGALAGRGSYGPIPGDPDSLVSSASPSDPSSTLGTLRARPNRAPESACLRTLV